MLTLNTIRTHQGARKRRKRIGRGQGSGHGATAGRGDKGQKARKSGNPRPGFEGGQSPLFRRLPKRGFKNYNHLATAIINLKDFRRIDISRYPEVTLDTLKEQGLAHPTAVRLAVLSVGELKSPFVIKADRFSKAALEKITKVGGKAEVVAVKQS